MPDHKWARGIVEQAFAQVFPGVKPSRASLQLVQANGALESTYGLATSPPSWIGSNNWGAVQCQKQGEPGGPCPDGCFPAEDETPVGKRPVCFRKYPSHVAGCAHMLKVMTRTPEERDALLAGNLPNLARAMRDASYYVSFDLMKKHGPEKGKELDIERRIKRMDQLIREQAQGIGEPDEVDRRGTLVINTTDEETLQSRALNTLLPLGAIAVFFAWIVKRRGGSK
jgi:hypothetical protein